MPIKVLNTANQTVAILQNLINPLVTEEINRDFTFAFSTVIDGDKSQYVNYQYKVEVEDNYFNVAYTEEERTADGIFVKADCEHVSYDLISANFTAGFTATGLISAAATTALAGTGFSVGTVDAGITGNETISINESTNAREIILSLAALYGCELEFDKYVVNFHVTRGANRGAQFRYRKNLIGVKRIVDNRIKVAGSPTIAYQTAVAELEFEQGYITAGKESFEHYELGDTVQVIDEDLSTDISLRILKESHNPEQRMQGSIEIGNFVDDIADTLNDIITTTVTQNKLYNGVSLGPDEGFVAERSDELVKTVMNATDGFSLSLRGTTTAAYTAVFYVEVQTATGTANLYLLGQADITGGSLENATINNLKTAESGQRFEINISAIQSYDSSTERMRLTQDTFQLFLPSGGDAGYVKGTTADSTAFLSIAAPVHLRLAAINETQYAAGDYNYGLIWCDTGSANTTSRVALSNVYLVTSASITAVATNSIVMQDDIVISSGFGNITLTPGSGKRVGITQVAWTAPTLLNSWVNYGSPNADAAYMKDSVGFVHLKGAIKDGTATSGTVLFALPAGYRPLEELTFPIISNDTLGKVWVTSGGNVTLAIGSNAWLALDGITFRAEQ